MLDLLAHSLIHQSYGTYKLEIRPLHRNCKEIFQMMESSGCKIVRLSMGLWVSKFHHTIKTGSILGMQLKMMLKDLLRNLALISKKVLQWSLELNFIPSECMHVNVSQTKQQQYLEYYKEIRKCTVLMFMKIWIMVG